MPIERYPDKPVRSTPAVFPSLVRGEWLGQLKYDGWRTLIERTAAGCTYTSREGKPIPVSAAVRAAPDAALAHLPERTILDGEWMARRAGVVDERFWLFDVMRHGRTWVVSLPTEARFEMLGSAVPHGLVVPFTRNDYAGLFDQSKLDPACEGIVLKRADSVHIASVRGCANNPNWMKVKWRDGSDGQRRVA